ncbi:dual specificity protein phosphatase 16-like [Actinia tenebrosa]|uniref:protein-tyrosine-phosphatase n=1 Tax=Actinia tenebrosa TaxID=6105 RepID=A0A6P8IIU6_ACTTE|nr:dual specificity protein phosphatase 16-like [Actinia tenebrosa]
MQSILSQQLAEYILGHNLQKLLIIDSRSFLEYNDGHVTQSINIGCSKLIKRRLISNKITIHELLKGTSEETTQDHCQVVVYDQSTMDTSSLAKDNFMFVILNKLVKSFKDVCFLKGGFSYFSKTFPELCESHSNSTFHKSPRTILSQPCLTSEFESPSHILTFLYLGAQEHALDADFRKANGIDFVLNVSCLCPVPANLDSSTHYMRIPVRDSVQENIIDWLPTAFEFIDKAREANSRVLVHCFAGKSRSATIAIAYIMKHLGLPLDEAYRFVKEKRPTISPNLNFMGQLVQFEKDLTPSPNDFKQESFGHQLMSSGSLTELTANV